MSLPQRSQRRSSAIFAFIAARATRPILALAGVLPLALAGCAGVGVFETSDPDRKIAQAYDLMEIDRFVLAERLIQEALEIYTKHGNEIGMAEAHHAFGNFYKNGRYHTKFANFYKRLGTYDGTYMRSIDNFSSARSLFEKHEDYAGVTKCLLGLGNAYSLRGESTKACTSYDEALDFYQKAKQKDPSVRLAIRKGYRDAEHLINAFRLQERCVP